METIEKLNEALEELKEQLKIVSSWYLRLLLLKLVKNLENEIFEAQNELMKMSMSEMELMPEDAEQLPDIRNRI